MVRKMNCALFVVIAVSIFLCNSHVSAQEKIQDVYYSNENGVELTEEEYKFLSLMYFDGYQKYMTQEDYKEFVDSDMMHAKISFQIRTFDDENRVVPLDTDFHASQSKELKISSACYTDECFIAVTLTWKKNPTVRSYDVIGAYFDGTALTNHPSAVAFSNSETVPISDLRSESKGIGSSFKLPEGSNVMVQQTYRLKPQGFVYASYQHAMKTSTLAISKDYTIDFSGYGNVFDFSSKSAPYYDGMGSVMLKLS